MSCSLTASLIWPGAAWSYREFSRDWEVTIFSGYIQAHNTTRHTMSFQFLFNAYNHWPAKWHYMNDITTTIIMHLYFDKTLIRSQFSFGLEAAFWVQQYVLLMRASFHWSKQQFLCSSAAVNANKTVGGSKLSCLGGQRLIEACAFFALYEAWCDNCLPSLKKKKNR